MPIVLAKEDRPQLVSTEHIRIPLPKTSIPTNRQSIPYVSKPISKALHRRYTLSTQYSSRSPYTSEVYGFNEAFKQDTRNIVKGSYNKPKELSTRPQGSIQGLSTEG